MPCSVTPAGSPRQAISTLRYCLPSFLRRRLPRRESFGAESHGLRTRCLRSVTTVTRSHVRLASGCWPSFAGRDWLPAGSLCRVSELVTSHPPCPGFSWRTRTSSRSRETSPGSDRIVPGWANGVVLDVERGHLRVASLLTGWIRARLKNSSHLEATPGRGATNECQNGVPGPEPAHQGVHQGHNNAWRQ
jgi:hypothetical protein